MTCGWVPGIGRPYARWARAAPCGRFRNRRLAHLRRAGSPAGWPRCRLSACGRARDAAVRHDREPGLFLARRELPIVYPFAALVVLTTAIPVAVLAW